jgi:NIPSNAP protein
MLKSTIAFAIGFLAGGTVLGARSLHHSQPAQDIQLRGPVVQLRLYTIDKGKLDDFADAWRRGVYPLRRKSGYRIPFAAKIPETNQFIWILEYDGPEAWSDKEAAYYGSADRKRLTPDPAQWIARPEQLMVQPVVSFSAPTP